MPHGYGAAQVGKSGYKDRGFKSSHKEYKSHSKDAKSTHHGKHSSSSGSSVPLAPSFLFVVNEFTPNFEPTGSQYQPSTDQWGNYVPPSAAEAYGEERPGDVFRYHRGLILPAEGYIWMRPPAQAGTSVQYQQVNQEGRIVPIFQEDDDNLECPQLYQTVSIFSCSAQLPIVLAETDASLGTSFVRNSCGCSSRYDNESNSPWSLLHFEHSQSSQVSYANPRAQGQPYVAGADPSWIPSLVPRMFTNRRRGDGPKSTALAGDLAVVIGLMAFHSTPGNASKVFHEGWWRDNRWYGPARTPSGYPAADEAPRGFLVQVCLDNLENSSSTEDALYGLGYNGPLVQG